MDIVSILITVLVFGFILWLFQKAPINDTVKQIASGVAILFFIIWVIRLVAPMLHIHF